MNWIRLRRNLACLSAYGTATPATWSEISAGNVHGLATGTDGTLWTWGFNASGALGLGIPPTYVSYYPAKVGTSNDWDTAAAGGNNSLAIRSDGTLWAWGENSSGQLGLGDNVSRSIPTQVGTQTTG